MTRGLRRVIEEGELGITGEASVQQLGWGWRLLGSEPALCPLTFHEHGAAGVWGELPSFFD